MVKYNTRANHMMICSWRPDEKEGEGKRKPSSSSIIFSTEVIETDKS